jgi:hypothetical protein
MNTEKLKAPPGCPFFQTNPESGKIVFSNWPDPMLDSDWEFLGDLGEWQMKEAAAIAFAYWEVERWRRESKGDWSHECIALAEKARNWLRWAGMIERKEPAATKALGKEGER